MKIKNKTQKKVILGILLVIFGLSAETFSQYYYFDNGGKSYQQGCNETVDIRINTKGENARAGRFHLILDPTTTIYETSDDVSVLRSLLVIGSSQTFLDWSAEIIPSWKSGTNRTILQIDRSNATTDYNGINGLYATVKFKPVFNVNNYAIQFGMEYNGLAEGSESTIETTLSKAGGIELINPVQQNLYRTGSYQILQEPCVSDTKVPTIASVSIANKTTKISHLSGLSFSLKDEGGANGSDVPYIWSGGVWTGNVGGIITNQYGIDLTRGTVTIIGEGLGQTVIPLTAVGVSVNGYKKTWQDNWLNFDVSIPSSLLFDFGVEKTISLAILFYDRAGNTGYYAKTFNAPQGPTLISNSRSPADGAVYVNLSDPIKLGIKDDWAGVNSGTIKITLSGVNGTDYGPYEFIGSALNLSGVQGGANTPDYYINISNHEQFPTSGMIKVRVYAEDMEGNVDTISDYTFTTRPNCSEFQCCDPVLLDLGSGKTTSYTNTGLIISGGVNPTFSGDEQNITGVIDCNTENEGLSVYTGEDNFMFFTDESELTILGTGVKGVLSGNVLTLSYIIDSAEIIVDKPSSGQILTTGDVDIRWHLTGVDDEDDWLSGYYIEIYIGDTLITGGFVDGTGITESLSDGEYEFVVYPIDLGGHTGSAATGSFSIDTVVPSVVLTGNDVGMCSPAGTIYTITGVFSEAVTGIDASTLTVTGGTVKSFTMVSGDTAVWTVSAGGNGETIGVRSGYMYYGDGTITICDPNDSTKCITMQDKNLGASEAGTGIASYGYHYQRGNNHGFAPNFNGDASFPGGESTGAIQVTNCAEYGPTLGGYDSSIFIWKKYDWCNPRNDDLRGGVNDNQNNRGFDETNNKATNVGNRRGPCDSGYHVPSIGERGILLEYRAANYTGAGNTNIALNEGSDLLPRILVVKAAAVGQFQEDFKIPFAGIRNNYYAKVVNLGIGAYLWSSSPDVGTDRARSFTLNPEGPAANITSNRAVASSLRCFKDSYLSFPSGEGGDSSTGALVISIDTGAFEDLAGNTNTTGTDELSWDYDGEGPEFVLDDVEVPECTEGTMTISGVTQVGCASGHVSPYSWDAGDTWGLTGTNTAYSGGIGEKIMTVRVRDAFGNYTEKTGKYTWTNVNPSADDISVENVGLGTGINWRELSNAHEGECGTGTIEFSGFIDDGSHGICTEEGGIITYVADTDTEYEGGDSCIFEITDDEGYTATGVITFTGIDTKKPTCEISYNENVCTSGDIALTMNATGAAEYSWNGFASMSSDNLSHNVHGNGVYTGYVRDGVGNTGICTVEVETFDDVLPIITIPAPAALTAEECTIIEGNIQVVDNGGCGTGFSYLWGGFGLGNDLSYSGYSEVVTGKTATVSVGDPAGNIANGTLNYTWTDTGVQLNSDEKIISDIVLTGGNSYNTTTGDLISLFGAREGNCGEKYISVSKISCNGLSMDIDAEGNVVVTGNNNLTQTGSCELRFSDDDGNSETGTLKIRVDTVVPGVGIQGTNLACMSGSSFSVTGIFTESVQGFVVGNISVENGTPSSLAGNGSEYTWTVNMNPNVEVKVKVPASAAFDLNGNPNTESNELTGMYDTAGPNKVILSERTKVYSETSKFTWQSVSDSGCAGVSGYIRELYEGSCEGTPKDSGATVAENFTVNGLENSGSYCRRVKAVDNFGNIGEWSDGDEFVVDLSDIGCDFDYVQTCTNGTLQVTLIPGDEGYSDNGTVYLSWQETGDWHNEAGLTTGVTYSGQTLTGYIWQPATEKFNSCNFVANNIIDKANPEITSVTVESVPECTTGTAIATAISDEGCGQGTYTYNWNSEGYMESNSFQRYLTESGTQIISLKVRDNALNESTSTGVVFVWTDSPISGNNFTGYTGVGRTARTVNWREMSEVSDGDCGSGTITFNGFVDTGTKGICTRVGDEITYTPNPNENGDDSCTIQVKDDEGGTKDIIISWEGIDTSGPTCTITKIPEACVSGSVEINLVANETISYAMGGNIQWGLSGNIATGILDINSTFGVEVRDLVGNTGICNVDITNINTGVLDAPVWLSPANGSNTNDNTLTLSWSGVSANGCRGVSGYEVQIIPSGGETITGFTNVNSWITPELPDGEYTIKVKTIDILGGESEWTGITITIDTEKPTCKIQYDNACISGNVQLTMVTTGADFYSWTNFSDMSESLAPNDISSNGTYYCFIKDLAGNTGINSAEITNIKTGVLSAPSGLTIVGRTPTNDNSPEFIWEAPESDGCREVSGYIVQILSGGDPIDTIPVDGTGWTPSSPLPDGEYTIIIKTEDTLSGESEGTGITFVVDTSAPNCSIEVMTANCTNSGVEIKLSGDISDILTYSWWNGTTGNFGNNITTGVYQNGEYTGYVYDEAGNEGACVGVVGTGIQDQILISYITSDAEGFECEVITGSIVGNTGDSCGKDDLSKFIYLRPGGINTSEYGTISGNVGIVDIDVTISDGAGNSTGTTVKYTWNDTGVTLSNGANQNIAVLTGTFEKTVAEIINMFGATEGACGTGNITVTGTICSGASISIENGIVSINPDADLDGVDGYCEFEFGDNEGEKTTTGKVTFIVDTKQPGVTLTGTNLVCMNTDTFDVTGTFTEAMMGFESGDVNVSGGIVSNFNGNGFEYTWKVHMTPMVETTVFVPAGVATDLNGNENTESNKLIGVYDNVGPNDVTFVNWQNTGFSRSTTLRWNATNDSGCVSVSGYNYTFASGTDCSNNILLQGSTSNTSLVVNDLSHEATYSLCVQPVDTLGNVGNRTTGTFVVDLNSIGCVINESACSSTGVVLTLTPGEGVEGEVSLSWTGYDDMLLENQLTKVVTELGLVEGYIQQNSGGTTIQSMCTFEVQNIDKENPIITSFSGVSVPECTTGNLKIIATDEGCGNTGLYYSWDNSGFALNSTIYSLWSGKAGSRIVDVQVKDNVGNTVSGSATIEWTDSPISGNDITVENVGRGSGVNWRELSEVSDGACGSGTVEFSGFVNDGSHGTCTTGEGDTIVYEPNDGYTGSDSCTIEVMDDDEQTKEITITWSGIDTEKPSCTLTVQDGQSCTSGEVTLSLSSNSDDVIEYSFDGENRTEWTPIVTTGTNIIGTYTGYVKDNAGNISDACSVEVTGGVLDLDNPTLEVSDWIGYECSTGSITVTGNDNSCGISGLYYNWRGFENITNTNEIYSGNVGSQTVDVTVFDGVGHSITEQVTYTWQNVPVIGNDFVVENVGTGITVDWFVNGNVSGGICELDDIEAISSNTGMCEISGHNVIYKPTEGVQGEESCIITITDQDEGGSGDIEIEITFTGVDTKRPTVELQGGIGEQCTSGDMFIVTGTFDEVVQGVTIDTLTGENVNIVDFTGNGDIYAWTVEMQGGTGRVWILTGGITDSIGNELMTGDEKILGNYDIYNPSPVFLSRPTDGQLSFSNSITFEWTESNDEGCAGISGYLLQICEDELCENVIRSSFVSGTGKTEGSLGSSTGTWTGYWRVISEDVYGNTGVSEIRGFMVDARNPNCSIVEQEMCTQGGVQLVLTGDRDITISDNGGVDRNGTGMYYTGEVSENGNILVIVEDVEGRTGQCEIPVTKHDAEGPEIVLQTGEVNECEGTTIQIVANDTGCAGIDGYIFGSDFGLGNFQTSSGLLITAEQIGRIGGIRKNQVVTVMDTNGNETTDTGYELLVVDVPVSLSGSNYSIGIITGNVEGLNIINIFGAIEGSCGIGDLTVETGNCTYATGILMDKVLTISPDDNIEQAGECEIYIKDNEGNIATGYISYQVDTQAPVCEISYSTTGWTNGNVVATINCEGEEGTGWFVTNNSGENEYTFEETGEFVFEFIDENGNTGSITGIVDWIDKTDPECTGVTYSVTGGTSGNVIVTFDTGSCTENVILLTGNGITGDEYEFEENGEITFIYEDDAGNTGELVVVVGPGEIVWIDKDAPICTVNVPDGWTNTGVTLTMNVEGDATGYSWNNVDWLGTDTGLFVENIGTYTGYVRDEVWNIGICTGLVEKIDKQKPTIILEGTNVLGCTNEPTFVVTGIFSEGVSGFTQDKISITNGNISDFMEVELGIIYTWTVTMIGGETKVSINSGVVEDRAWNKNTESNELTSNYDNAGPGRITMIRPDSSSGMNYGSTLVLQWNEVEDQGCVGVSGYVYKVCEDFDCNTVVSGGTTDGTGVEIENLGTGTYYRTIYPEDNYGNTGDETTGQVFVDLTRIGCRFVETACSNTGVMLSMFIDGSGTHLSWTGEGYWEPVTSLLIEINEPLFSITGFVYDEETNRTGYCEYTVNNIDKVNPTIDSVINVTGYECETITGSFVVTDEGCGSGLISYIWDGLNGTNNSEYGLFNESGNNSRIVYVTGTDGVWNTVTTGVKFEWLNSPITWVDFTGDSNVGNSGRSANWREMSQVSDGACGSGTIVDVRVVNSGSKGECMVEGDTVTYTPYMGQTGSDVCVLKVRDDEGDTGSISIAWEGIDTDKPSCTLTVQDGQSCTSGEVVLSLSSDSDDVVEYSFDGENRTTGTPIVTTGTNIIGIYAGYVKDSAGNISEACSVEVTGGVLDLDNPTLEVSDWIGYECSTGSITVTGNDNSCGLSGLKYGWMGFENITNTNEIYSGNVGSQTVDVTVFDGVGHSITEQVTYTWQNVPVTGNDFVVENVGTGITIDWFVNGNVSGGICELDDIEAISSNTGMCEISGHNVIYKPTERVQGEERCTITITDQDEGGSGDIEIEITFTGVDTLRPTVELQGGIGEQCTNTKAFVVTGTFSEEVTGANSNILSGENIEKGWFTKIDNSTYVWIIYLKGGTGKVWIDNGSVTDLTLNENEGSNVLILGNYDNKKPQLVTLLSPGTGAEFNRRTIDFEWTVSDDEGCAGLSGYIINICRDSSCNNVVETISTKRTGETITLQNNGNYYWRVTPVDNYGNRNTGAVRRFSVQSNEPSCNIVQSACSSSPVNLILTGNKEIFIESGNITWSQISGDTYTAEVAEIVEAWTIVKDSDNQTGYCHLQVTNYDNAGPNFEFETIEVDEGKPLSIIIEANDTGCAEISGYNFGSEFGSGEWQISSGLSITAEQIGNSGGIEKDQVVSVIDTLGNITTKTGKIVINDIKPTITQTGTIDGVQTGEVIVDVIDLLGAQEGDLGTGDLEVEIDECIYATGYISGHNLIVNIAQGAEGIGYCTVKIKDNEGSYSDVDGVIEFEVDTKEPVCTGLVFNPAGWTSGDSVSVSLTGCSEPIYSGDTTFVFTGNGDHTFEFEDDMGNTGEVVVHFTGFDREGPNFDFNNNSGYECETGTLTISNTVDTGIGLADLPYSFDGMTRNTLNTKQIYSGGAGEIRIPGYVRDKLGNYKLVQAEYVFNDSKPTATGFSLFAFSGAEVNWKELSNATDGACGSGVLSANVSGGSMGTCSISGDIFIYQTNPDVTILSDTCDLIIYDDEGNSTTVTVELKGISSYPDVELVTPINGLVLDPGKVRFAWKGQGNDDMIDKYVYNIWSSNDDYTVEQTGVEVSIDLRPGAYHWNVYAKYIDATTGGLSDTYSFNVVGQSSGLTKDRCPYGDFSQSYYDGTCDASGYHNAADMCGVSTSKYSNELKLAYLYSYSYGITTMCPIESAFLDGYLIRSHFAKMISEFAVNVLGKEPDEGKEGCDEFDDIDSLDAELYDLVITSCELDLMGQESDGVTPAKSFNPNDYVTRAQFGTVLSRLLFGDVYNIKDESKVYMNAGFWYKDHLEALKRYGIMTKIDGDWPNSLERRGWVMLMLQRADEYGVFAGKIPAKNGVKALFDE